MIDKANNISSYRILQIMLLRSEKYSFLPELLDEVGEEAMYKLLNVFAGTKIEFPSVSKLERYAREITIYQRLNEVNSSKKSIIVNCLCEEYDIDNDTVWSIYRKIAKLAKDACGVKITHNNKCC